ncbi:MAG: 30S ribosomal protein S20 [Verrucomicrobia bacterium]|nr:30S ribosomal protein S20 [Verrucomicrobiota bacterium]MCG2679779.1 30S ribosomal protein S20 [Kiritimatiellia bacterium]MBU4247098.1 30S ribosomal protein S20 [Verrucomicrobiota bacterium]MBU4289984.1 30S ribosomal protein S20 [Verrucomicrobiota bacterium]MBU4428647.1 30S ribosomal protein S20 [Verrucomicrobiota bacterium]
MPNLHSALKRVHVAEKSRRKNRSTKAKISTVRRHMFAIVLEKDKEKARQTFREYCSVLDRAAKNGVIKKNTAIRRKRRAALKLAVLEKAG